MIKCFVYLFIIACFFNVYNATVLDLNEYLNQKGNYLQEIFNEKNHLQSKRDSNTVMIKNLQESIYPELKGYIKILSLSNNTHILTENGVYEIINNSVILRQDMGRLEKLSQKNVTFFKSIMFNETGFMVFKSGFSEDSYIYQLVNGSSYNFIQTIQTPYAEDAHFFINNNNLYLIVANNKGDSLAVTSIYKWLGFHFDEIQTVFTTGAIKVGSFTTRSAEIIIILQDIPNKALPSAVFKFNNDEIKKIQLLTSYHGIHLETYCSKNKKYIIVFTRLRNNVIYEWNDVFIIRSIFQTEEVVYNSQIFSLNGTSFLGISFSNKLQIYDLFNGKIRLENEIQDPPNLTKIIDFNIKENGTTYIIGFDEKENIKIKFISKFNFTNTDLNLEDRDVLRECFKALEIKVESANKKLVELKNKLSERARFRRDVILKAENLVHESDVENQIQMLKNRIAEINSTVDKYKLPVDNNIIINGKVNFKGEVNSKKITGRNIVIKEINGNQWTPEQWLKYTEPQTMTGFSRVKTITANEVETSSDDPLFKDLLLNNKDQTINGSVAIHSLTVPKLYAKNINGIPMEEVYFKNKPQQIKGVKTFKYLNVDDLNMTTINKDSPDEIISSVLSALPNLDLDSNITIENLEVETINGIHWEEFKNSVFRINITKEITGPVTFAKIKTKDITVKKIRDIEVSNLLTTTTDQIIESNMEFKNIFANELKLETVNGIKIPQDVVLVNENTTVQGPITIDKMKVLNDAILSGKFDDSFFLKDDDHIIGTKSTDFLQIYSGKVTINGNLHLSNLKMLPNAKLIVSGIEVNPNFTDNYWTKNTHQIISVPVNFLQGITTPHLLTKVLNNVKIDQYLLNNDERRLETDFKFENVTVKGNIVLNEAAHHRPDFNKILKEAVQTTGNYVIHGKKRYLNTLKAQNLQTIRLDGINVDEALNNKWPKNITSTKTYKNMIVKNDVDVSIDGVKTINGISLENYLQKIIFIDSPVNITQLDFENITVTNLKVNEVNNHGSQEFTSLKETLKNAKVINNLKIKGNVTIDHIKNMTFLNDKPFSELLKNRPKVGKHGILDDVEFTGKLKVRNFTADHVNDISLRNLTRRVLNRQYSQTIKSHCTFSNLKADNILTKTINNVSIENVIDTRTTLPQKIFSPNGSVSLSNIAIMRNLEAAQLKPCGLDTINIEFADPPTQKWTEILIKGNVTVLDEESFIYRLFEKTVKLNSKNVIHSDVNISSGASMKNLHSNNLINDVNIPHLLEDAVLTKSSGEQKITGKKWFTTLRTRVADILGETNADFINEENVTALNNDLVDKNGDKVIRGKKTFFRGLQTNKFNSKTVSGVNPDDIVNLDHPKLISEAVFDTLDVRGDLNIKIYDRKNFTDFTEKRLLTNGLKNQVATGIYFFEDIEVQNFTTPIINDIKVEDIVFDEGTQNISSVKQFKHPLTVNGNISVNFVNGANITYEFLNSIPLKGSVKLASNIVVSKPSNINGSLTATSINGFPVTSIKELLSSNITEIETEEIYFLKEQLIKKINKNLPIVQSLPTDFMYLEKTNSLQITVPNTFSGSTITSNGYVLLHVNGQEAGTFCGLPSSCVCPVQYTIEISPQNSITTFPNKGFQRIFSYDDDTMTINFMTNSISISSTCRTSHSKVFNELSMMTWNTKSQDGTIGQFHQYDKFLSGYISKVDFFTLNGKTYAVVGRYYDPITDKYELDCSILRFNDNKTHVLEIQIIPTKGVQEVYLLPTAQGVVLILGNKMPFDFHHEQEETQIFRFNPDTEQFGHLRTIPTFGCSSAAGVVHGSDSLIALAHKEAPVQVLKYYPEFDNYYIYQSFELDQPVIGISSFYAGGFGISDAYICLVTSHEKYYIYAYQFLEGFKLKSTGKLDGLRNLVPFELNMQTYLFAPSAQYSSLLSVVKNGSS